MSFLVQKLSALDAAIVEGKTKTELRGYIVDLLDYLRAHESDLTAQNDILRSELSQAAEQNKALKAQLYDAKEALEKAAAPKREQESADENRKDDICMLLTNRVELTTEQIAAQLKMHPDAASPFLIEMENDGLIFQRNSAVWMSSGRVNPPRWCLQPKGQARLVRRGKLA